MPPILSGWPGERIAEAAGTNRLWVSNNMLRKLGSRDVLAGALADTCSTLRLR